MANPNFRNWSELHCDLVGELMKKLSFFELIPFSGVCSTWRSAAKSISPPAILAVPDCHVIDNLDDHKISIFNPLYLGVEEDRKEEYYLIGSSKGILILVDKETSSRPVMINPITRTTYHCPWIMRMTYIPKIFNVEDSITKAILVPIPTSHLVVLVIMYGRYKINTIAYCIANAHDISFNDFRDTNSMWTKLSQGRLFFDVVSAPGSGTIYTLSQSGSVESWVFCNNGFVPGRASSLPEFPTEVFYCRRLCKSYERRYLAVGQANELFLVRRFVEHDSRSGELPYRTTGIRLYRANYDSSSPWEEVDQSKGSSVAVFVGVSESRLVPRAERGCVYFTDDNMAWKNYKLGRGHDAGVYDLEKKTFVVFLGKLNILPLPYPPPFWFIP